MKKLIKYLLLIYIIASCSQNKCDKFVDKYIPVSLEEAFDYFECRWSKEKLQNFKNDDEDSAGAILHRTVGMGIRNSWGFWKKEGKLYEFFKAKGISHPDDMSGIIFDSFHRKLNNKPIELNKQIKHYQDFWKKSEEEARERFRKRFVKYKIGDTLIFKYLSGFISDEQKTKIDSESCISRGVAVKKRESDFSLLVKIINTCDEKGMYTGDDYGKPNRRISKKGDSVWISYNAWEIEGSE